MISASRALSRRFDQFANTAIDALGDLFLRVPEQIARGAQVGNLTCRFWPNVPELKCFDAFSQFAIACLFGGFDRLQACSIKAISQHEFGQRLAVRCSNEEQAADFARPLPDAVNDGAELGKLSVDHQHNAQILLRFVLSDMQRVVLELRGMSCLELEEVAPAKKQIVSSRAFGSMVTTYRELEESVSTYAARAGEKLRRQASTCAAVHVFVETNRFREDLAQYSNAMTVPLTVATNDTRRLTAAALWGLKRVYRPGYQYKKAGVMLMELTSASVQQMSLISDPDPRSDKVMKVMDALNADYGRNTVALASAGIQKKWSTLFQMKTPRYTTRWDELPMAKA
jgi:hypothetical protein